LGPLREDQGGAAACKRTYRNDLSLLASNLRQRVSNPEQSSYVAGIDLLVGGGLTDG
jgi:hypothetical protein